MTRTVTTALVLTFLLAINAPSFAQQTGPTTNLRNHPAVERLLKNSKDGEPTVQLKGYVIQSSPETVRLYWDLTLSRYFEIPLSAVVDQVQGTDPETVIEVPLDWHILECSRTDKGGGVVGN
jgi:hypothetical protein